MKWQKKPVSWPLVGDTRILRSFLVWPRTIGSTTRWLERAWIRQEFRAYTAVLAPAIGSAMGRATVERKHWEDVAWLPDAQVRRARRQQKDQRS